MKKILFIVMLLLPIIARAEIKPLPQFDNPLFNKQLEHLSKKSDTVRISPNLMISYFHGRLTALPCQLISQTQKEAVLLCQHPGDDQDDLVYKLVEAEDAYFGKYVELKYKSPDEKDEFYSTSPYVVKKN